MAFGLRRFESSTSHHRVARIVARCVAARGRRSAGARVRQRPGLTESEEARPTDVLARVRRASSSGPEVTARGAGEERRAAFREFYLGLKRGLHLGRCGTCETFYLMARLCAEEGGAYLSAAERSEVGSWLEAGSVLDLEFGCEGACNMIRLYPRDTP